MYKPYYPEINENSKKLFDDPTQIKEYEDRINEIYNEFLAHLISHGTLDPQFHYEFIVKIDKDHSYYYCFNIEVTPIK